MQARILVMEPDAQSMSFLVSQLQNSLYDVQVDSAASTADALTLIKQSPKDSPYWLAILTFTPSATSGEVHSRDIDATVCNELDPSVTDILHVANGAVGKEAQKHMLQRHPGTGRPAILSSTGEAPQTLFEKGDLDWAQQLLCSVRRHLAPREVEQAIAEAFKLENPAPARLSPALALQGAVDVIVHYWADLNLEQREWVRKYFTVTDKDDKITEIRLPNPA